MALVGQNFGIQAFDRIQETFRETLKLGLFISFIFIPIMVIWRTFIDGFFLLIMKKIIATGTLYLRADAVAFYAYVIIFTCVAVLQAIKQPNFPLVIGILRQLLLPTLVNYILIVHLGYPLSYLFWSIVSIVIVSAVIMYWYTRKQLRGTSIN